MEVWSQIKPPDFFNRFEQSKVDLLFNLSSPVTGHHRVQALNRFVSLARLGSILWRGCGGIGPAATVALATVALATVALATVALATVASDARFWCSLVLGRFSNQCQDVFLLESKSICYSTCQAVNCFVLLATLR